MSLLAGICLVGESALSAADRASLVYDIFDFDTRREISKDEMTILLLCTVRAAKVVAGAGEDPSDDIMEATTAPAFEKHAARLDVIKKDEFVAWAAEETKVVDSLTALLIKFGSLKGELPAAPSGERYNTLLPSPAGAKYALAVVQFKVPGHPNGGSDKGPDGNRIDSIPIANGVIKAGGRATCLYDYTDHAGFEATIEKYDALIVRINPGQLSQIPGADGAQAKFDATMNVRRQGQALAGDGAMLKLMEMNDNHVEYHTVKEFLVFCVDGPSGAGAGTWTSTFPGEYLKGGAAAGGQLVDQRLLPRISEGEVRVLMAGDTCQMIIHKKPEGGLSAVGGNSAYACTSRRTRSTDLLTKLTTDIKNGLMDVLDLKGEALPLLWTCDYIPKNPEGWSKTENARHGDGAVCGGDKTLADVPDADYYEACKLTDLMGIKAPRCSTRRGVQGPLQHAAAVAGGRQVLAGRRPVQGPRPPERRLGQGPGRNRIDSIPIANGVIKAGGACDMLLYDYTDHAGFEATIEKYDALIVRINPGQLSQIPGADGAQASSTRR
ncbi:hypothetical protein JL721_510 [Aureococcus anophagefferens]|nr:hypothetical protein JL721_510 [Aureococcus anophagefferens]